MTPVLELGAILVENGEGGQSRLPSSDMATRLATKPRPKTRSDGPIVSFPNSSSRHTSEIHPPHAASSYSSYSMRCRIRVRNSLNEIEKGKLTRQELEGQGVPAAVGMSLRDFTVLSGLGGQGSNLRLFLQQDDL